MIRSMIVLMLAAVGFVVAGCQSETDPCGPANKCLKGWVCLERGRSCIEAASLQIVAKELPDAVLGQPYDCPLQASGGWGDYTWSMSPTDTWLSIHADSGLLSGTPTEASADVQVLIEVTDSSYAAGQMADNSHQKVYHFQVIACSSAEDHPCSGHGTCTRGTCECHPGFAGDRCEGCAADYHREQDRCVLNAVCQETSCSMHGGCDDQNGVIACACHVGYEGDHCERCAEGYHWEQQNEQVACVEDEVCPPNAPCSGHGACDDSTGVAICTCNPGYAGDECASCAVGFHQQGDACAKDEICLPNTCSGNGKCDDSAGVVICTCNPGYAGDFCEIQIETKITVQDARVDEHAGTCVSISGDHAIVGAPIRGTDAEKRVGVAYVFRREGRHWIRVDDLTASDPQARDEFGRSVSISGDHAIVGAPFEDGGTADPARDAGAAYVFGRNARNEWVPVAKLEASDPQAYAYFGDSVSISGDHALVGAPRRDSGTVKTAGAAYVFSRNAQNEWVPMAKLEIPDPRAGERLGYSASISGDHALVGAPRKDGDTVKTAGAAYAFRREGQDWVLVDELTAADAQGVSDGEADAWFGISVSISGDHAIVGTPKRDVDTEENAGAVYVYRHEGHSWVWAAELVSSDGQVFDNFGYSVSISGDHALVGAPFEDGGEGDPTSNVGAAYGYLLPYIE